MRVLFIVRSTFYTSSGGDTVQVRSTAKYLERNGVYADIKLTGDPVDYNNYSLIHFFNIIRPADILPHVKKSKLPFVVSSIFVDYSEYEQRARGVAYRLFTKMLNPYALEYVKLLARVVLNGESFPPAFYLLHGHKESINYVIQRSRCLLPNSENEYRRLTEQFARPVRHVVIPNAVDGEVFTKRDTTVQRAEKKVICVGRIEGRKNQLNLIRALNDSEYSLYIIGKPSPNHRKYYDACRREASKNIFFIDEVSQQELIHHYLSAKVHVLPSWFETTGLSSLEAAYLGCAIVVTDKGDTIEYFGDDAFYCDPDKVESIFRAVHKAAEAGGSISLRQKIAEQYTWDIAANKTAEVYYSVLKVNDM